MAENIGMVLAKVLEIVAIDGGAEYGVDAYEFSNGLVFIPDRCFYSSREEIKFCVEDPVARIEETGKTMSLSVSDIEKAMNSSIELFGREFIPLELIKQTTKQG